MELRDIERLPTIGDLIDDTRYGFALTNQTERWETHERIERQRTERHLKGERLDYRT